MVYFTISFQKSISLEISTTKTFMLLISEIDCMNVQQHFPMENCDKNYSYYKGSEKYKNFDGVSAIFHYF